MVDWDYLYEEAIQHIANVRTIEAQGDMLKGIFSLSSIVIWIGISILVVGCSTGCCSFWIAHKVFFKERDGISKKEDKALSIAIYLGVLLTTAGFFIGISTAFGFWQIGVIIWIIVVILFSVCVRILRKGKKEEEQKHEKVE